MSTEDDTPVLTFAWRERDYRGLKLLFYLLLTITGAVLFFMLFKVVYPQAEHISVSPQYVMVLDPTQPATRDLINRTRDENFLLLGQGTRQSTRLPDEQSHFPVFQPSFQGHEMKLVDLPVEPDVRELPRLFSIQQLPLPPVTTVAKPIPVNPEKTGTPSPRVALNVLGNLKKRWLQKEELGKEVKLDDPSPVRFSIGVDDKGQVASVVPLWTTTEGRQYRVMHRAVTQLRFKPSPKKPLEWGEVSFEWKSSP
jgi:hypothetical protein